MIFQCGGEKFPKRHDKEGMNTITQRDEPRVLPHTIERSIVLAMLRKPQTTISVQRETRAMNELCSLSLVIRDTYNKGTVSYNL